MNLIRRFLAWLFRTDPHGWVCRYCGGDVIVTGRHGAEHRVCADCGRDPEAAQ